MHPARIAELLEPFLGPPDAQRLTPDALLHISTYIDLLLRWNARINLTAIRDPEEVVTRHFGESLFAARHLFPTGSMSEAAAAERRQIAAHGASRGSAPRADSAPEGRKEPSGAADGIAQESPNAQRPAPNARPTLADIGSGAGFPGIPIKLWAPQISLTLIESNQKKSTFLREVTRALTLTNVNIQTTRAESLPGITFDVVTLRAVERFATILPTATSLVVPGGRLALLIGSTQEKPARASVPAFTWSDPTPVPTSRSRILVIGHRPR
jgi:16S rRNA (guanine527-N7)-methyltransferase